jgi:uncharacterized membrane protein
MKMTTPLCQRCGIRPAAYVCQSCGRSVCSNCFNPAQWFCDDCAARTTPSPAIGQPVTSYSAATWLLLIAFAMITIGFLLMIIGPLAGSAGGFSGGAVILIGPIPIVLGIGPYSWLMIAFAAVLTVLAVAVFLLFRRRV